jgi:transcriptional regulator with XRE-family HTH domain
MEGLMAAILEAEVTYGELIDKLIEDRGLSSAKLEELSGVAKRTIEEYRQNRMNPSLENAIKIAQAFGLTLDEFMKCTPAPPRRRKSRKGK